MCTYDVIIIIIVIIINHNMITIHSVICFISSQHTSGQDSQIYTASVVWHIKAAERCTFALMLCPGKPQTAANIRYGTQNSSIKLPYSWQRFSQHQIMATTSLLMIGFTLFHP